MAGKHRAKKTARRQTEAYVWLGTGAITLALGVALTGGSGVAQADTTSSAGSGPRVSPSPGNSAATTSIRTTISAQSVHTSTHSSTPAAAGGGEERATSIVSTRESVVRKQDPAVTGDDNPGPGPTLAETVIGLNNGDPEAISGIPGLEAVKDIPFIELGGGGGGLLSKIAGALSKGMF